MPLQMTFDDKVLKREVRDWERAVEFSKQEIMRLDDRDGNARFNVASQTKRGVRFVVSIRPPKNVGDVLSSFANWAADCSCHYVGRRGNWCKHIGGCFLSLRGASNRAAREAAVITRSGRERTSRKVVDYRWLNERTAAIEHPAFHNSRVLVSKKVEFEETTLSPEKITELHSRASKSVRERERRSQSRTKDPDGPKVEVRPVEPVAPPKEGIGEVLELLDANGVSRSGCALSERGGAGRVAARFHLRLTGDP